MIPLHTLFHNHVNQSDPHGPRARTPQRSRQTSSNRFRKSTPSSSILPPIHLSLNKAPLRLPNNFLSLTHSLTHKNRSTGPPSLKTSTTKLPKPLAINGILFVINFLEELRRAPTTTAPAATATRRVVVERILLRRLFVRRRGNLVSFLLFGKRKGKRYGDRGYVM